MLDQHATESNSETPLWNDDETSRELNCGRTLLWKLERIPGFPKPIRVGRKYKRWSPIAIRKWIRDQQEATA